MPIHEVIEANDRITLYSEIQGPKCIDVMKNEAGKYILCRTYNILPNDTMVYQTETPVTIKLTIPEKFRQAGRKFAMIGVTAEGRSFSLPDLDKSDETITFKTSEFYAFGLAYSEE